MGNKIVQFLREAKAELLKVNWPTKKQVMAYTLAVMESVLLWRLF